MPPRSRLGGLGRVVHPFPSILNALLVVGLALVAGGSGADAILLGLAMLGLQFSIGAFNDVCDIDLDARAKPQKPIPAGLVSRREALVIATVGGGGGLALAAAVGPLVLLLAALMLAAGLAYDAWLKRGPWGWTAFALAFPLLPIYAWYGAVGTLPPRPELLLPVAALAGPTLQLANGLIDLEADAATGVVGLAGRLGRRGSLAVMAVLQLSIHGLAWSTIIAGPPVVPSVLLLVAASSGLTAVGVVLSSARPVQLREWGWRAQASGLVLLALGWLTAVTAAA